MEGKWKEKKAVTTKKRLKEKKKRRRKEQNRILKKRECGQEKRKTNKGSGVRLGCQEPSMAGPFLPYTEAVIRRVHCFRHTVHALSQDSAELFARVREKRLPRQAHTAGYPLRQHSA